MIFLAVWAAKMEPQGFRLGSLTCRIFLALMCGIKCSDLGVSQKVWSLGLRAQGLGLCASPGKADYFATRDPQKGETRCNHVMTIVWLFSYVSGLGFMQGS